MRFPIARPAIMACLSVLALAVSVWILASGRARLDCSVPPEEWGWRDCPVPLIFLSTAILVFSAVEIRAHLRRRQHAASRFANPQGGANGRQPSGSETNRPSAAAASRHSP